MSSGLGTVLGGLVLGLLESLGAGYLSASYKDAIAFIILLLILFIRPRDYSGKRKRKEYNCNAGKLSEGCRVCLCLLLFPQSIIKGSALQPMVKLMTKEKREIIIFSVFILAVLITPLFLGVVI